MDAIPRVPEALDFPPVQLNFVDTYTNTTTNEVESSVRREGSMQRGGPTARVECQSRRGWKRNTEAVPSDVNTGSRSRGIFSRLATIRPLAKPRALCQLF